MGISGPGKLVARADGGRTSLSDEMPKGWAGRRLDECAEVNSEQLLSKTDPNFRMEYLDIGAIEHSGVIAGGRPFRFGDAPSRARRLARDGDILVSTVRPYLRNFGRVQSAPDNLVVSTGYAVVRPSDDVDGDFLYQHILSDKFVNFLGRRMNGSNYPAVRAADVESYPLSLPPLAQQRKIGIILGSVDDVIGKSRSTLEQIRLVKRGLIQSMLAPAITKMEWRSVSLGEVADHRTEKLRPKLNDKIPYVALEHLAQGTPDILGWRESREANSEKTIFRMGDVLFGKLRPNLRKGALAPFDGVCSTDIVPIYSGDDLDERFLVQLVHSQPFRRHAMATSSGTKMPRTSWKQLKRFTFRLPSLHEQMKIGAVLSSVDAVVRECEANIGKLMVVKRSLMAGLLSGELCVTPDRRDK